MISKNCRFSYIFSTIITNNSYNVTFVLFKIFIKHAQSLLKTLIIIILPYTIFIINY